MKKLSYVLVLIGLALSACGHSNSGDRVRTTEPVSSLPAEATQQVNYLIGPREFSEKIKTGNVVVLDVRTPGETANGIIEGASQVNFSDPDFRQRLGDFDKDVTYLVYCASGGRSKSTQKMMNSMGFNSVYDLQGGIIAWQNAGLPLVKK